MRTKREVELKTPLQIADPPVGRRKNRRSDATRLQVIEVAERLFGSFGANGVSLRQIAAAAGSANPSLVAYHFGDKEGLLRAIFEQRLGDLEAQRGRLLQRLRREGRAGDLRALVEAQFLPLVRQRDAEGRRSYAAFVAGLHRFNQSAIRMKQSSAPTPVTDEINALIRKTLPPQSDRTAARRLRMVFMMICDTVALLDASPEFAKDGDAAAIEDLFDMVAAALAAPHGEPLAEA